MGGFVSYWCTSCEATQHASWGAKLSSEVPLLVYMQYGGHSSAHLLRWCSASLPFHLPQVHPQGPQGSSVAPRLPPVQPWVLPTSYDLPSAPSLWQG